ncbi:RxLR effector protein [Phytophthora megakarya]|uniref:RxLR effector protein n=1 Tax=Phytophthora megakarya TaxID=4795 RepID=A0A225VV77_9STRA|nr:RxLR effector protein [Phytophthora megakarya]
MIKLSRMMKDEAFKVKMFKTWDKHQQSIGKIRKMMFLGINPQYQKLLLEYLNNYQRKSPKVTKSTASVHSPGNGKRVKWADPLTDVRKFDADSSNAEVQFTWVIWPYTKSN